MKKEVLKETTRDLIALGSVPFFILVLARVWMLNKPIYFTQFLIAGIFMLALFFLLKPNLYSGLGFITLIFTGLYYGDNVFWIFGSLIYVCLLASLFYLNYEKKKILLGVLFGCISFFAARYLVSFLYGS
jgi:hypothetical protein